MCLCKGKEVVFAFPFWLLNFQSNGLDMAEAIIQALRI